MSDDHKSSGLVEQRSTLPVRAEGVHPLAQMAMSADMDVEKLEKLIALQERADAQAAKRAYAAAMVRLKRDLPSSIEHDATVDFRSSKGRTHYTHATSAKIFDEVTDALTQHGFFLSSGSGDSADGKRVVVFTTLTHEDGHSETRTKTVDVDNSGGKNAIQGVASTGTYLKRYQTLDILGIATRRISEEPVQSDPATDINPDLNRRAAAKLATMGKDRQDAEAHISKPIEQWTGDDLRALGEWAKTTPADACEAAEPETVDAEFDYGPPAMDAASGDAAEFLATAAKHTGTK